MIAFAHAGCASDEALVREIQEKTEGAGQAWAELNRRYYGFLSGCLRGQCPRWADEIAADTLANLWEYADRFNGGSVRAWLVVSARNAAISKLRRSDVRHERGFEVGEGDDSITIEPEVESSAGHVDGADFVARMMSILSQGERELFVRYHVDGVTVPQLASEVGMSEAHIYRALRSIRESLRKWAAVNQGIEEYAA